MFKERSTQLELLDETDIAVEALHRNLYELEIINKILGGHNVSLAGLKIMWPQSIETPVIADLGCGGGDTLKAFAIWTRKNKKTARFIGIDLKQDCIQYAQENCKNFPEISFICQDFRDVIAQKTHFDLVHTSLFNHHLNNDENMLFLDFCNQNKLQLIINDLERHPLAYYSIKLLTQMLSKSYLVKNDAPLSVLRGFKKNEWRQLLTDSKCKSFTIDNYFPFRHLILLKHDH